MIKKKIENNSSYLTIRIYGTIEKEKGKSVFLFLNGWNPGSVSWTFSDVLAWLCATKKDALFITMSFRGMGSEGDINKLTRADFLNDATTVYDYISAQKFTDPNNISLIGESFGGYIASVLSSKRTIKNLILRVPTDFPNEGFFDIPHITFAGSKSIEWKQEAHPFRDSYALEAVHNYKKRIFLIASEKDLILPFQTIKNYLSAGSDKKMLEFQLMKNTGHSLVNPMKLYKFSRILIELIGK
jgi:uncharacterized protein